MSLFLWPPNIITGVATEATALDILATVDGVETLIGTTNTNTANTKTAVDSVKTAVDLTTTAVNTVNTTTGTVKTAVDAVKTSVDAVTTRLNTMPTAFFTKPFDEITPTASATEDIFTSRLASVVQQILTIYYSSAAKTTVTNYKVV